MYKHNYFDRKTRNCIGYVSGQSLHYTLKASWALDICTKIILQFQVLQRPIGIQEFQDYILLYSMGSSCFLCKILQIT
jgi:hypothetical protein